MEGTIYTTKEAILQRAREIIGIPLGEVDHHDRLTTGKGAVGTVIEESWFHYTPNSEAGPDFPEAGVELKVTPYIRKHDEVRAKERLVCNIINYMTEYDKDFYSSAFYQKCNTMLMMFYEYLKGISKADYTITEAILFQFPVEDLLIIEHDWEIIMGKVRHGLAHTISEGDTLYLAACTKGVNSRSMRPQPFSSIPAKQRAYSLKSSYMTHIIRTYVFGNAVCDRIIKDPRILHEVSFEEYILGQISPYLGYTQENLKNMLGVTGNPKNLNEILLAKMLGVSGKIAATDEFQKAGIVPKTIRVQKNGHIKESMSFPYFDFIELSQETWEDSTLRNYLAPTKFLFVIFQENDSGEYLFSRVQFWNIPEEDLEEVHQVWERTVFVLRNGVELFDDGKFVHNNFPKKGENPVAHVRPHARDRNDTLPLPDGRYMPKQCFWLNNTYIEKQIQR